VTTRVVQIEPGPDADLHGVHAALDERRGALARGHVADDELHVGERLAHAARRVEHALRVAVRGVDHQHVDAGVHEGAARAR
jgi:hypothetical protein